MESNSPDSQLPAPVPAQPPQQQINQQQQQSQPLIPQPQISQPQILQPQPQVSLQSQQQTQQTQQPPMQTQMVTSQPTPASTMTQTSTQPTYSIATTPAVSQLSQGIRAVGTGQMRPRTEYLFLLPQGGSLRHPMVMNINQPNILQGNPTLLRSINASQLIRAQTSSGGVMQTQTSQAQTTTMANIQGQTIQIPFSAAGPHGQITLANGQTIMPSIPIQRHQMMGGRAILQQQPTLLRGVPPQAMGIHPVIPGSQSLRLGHPTSLAASSINQQASVMSSAATAPSQMTPDEALSKGISFFNSLLTRANLKSKKNLQNLIQSVIDGKKSTEEFTAALQRELNSGPQAQLVPFLELMLPGLRQSLNNGQTKLPGIRPPSLQDFPQSDEHAASTSSPNSVQSYSAAKKKKVPLPPGQKSAYALKKEAREAKKKEREILAAQGIKVEKGDDKTDSDKADKQQTKPKSDKPRSQNKQKKQEKQLESLSSALRDDDDVNDVAAMGGVNLAEESQKIMASGAELVGTQIRSCKDEPFLDMNSLFTKINKIVKEYNLSEPSKEVVTLVSHATQERLKNIVERLGVLAEHRGENLKFNPKYEPSNDVKGQIKFLAELDRIEKRRYEEQERELLLRVAKSRSKVEDPEQQKLRQKAKDMQRAEQEEVRQREANETALLAIGPRKKLKTSASSPVSSFSQSSGVKDLKPSVDVRGDTIRRIKRVNMRDLQILLELDRTYLNRLVKIAAQ